MVNTGSNAAREFCRIKPMRLPRTASISASLFTSKSSPSKRTCPLTMRAPRGSNLRMDRQVTVLPEPDSPTSPRVSPGMTLKLTPFTALTTPARVKKCVRRSRTSKSGLPGGLTVSIARSPCRLEIEMVEGGDVCADDLPPLFLRHSGEDLLQDLPRAREGRLGVGIIGPPHQGVHADQRPIADAKRVFLKAEEDVTPEEVAGQHVAAEATTRGAWRVAYRCNRG